MKKMYDALGVKIEKEKQIIGFEISTRFNSWAIFSIHLA